MRGSGLVTAWASGLNLLADLAAAHERWSRLRRQRRLMQRMWTEAFTPVALAATDDPFRGLAMLPSRT
jgi:hypothetical protein